MTEDEAKTKWCPLADQGTVSAYRMITLGGMGSGAHTQCIASACMAWRWAAQPYRAKRLNPDLPTPFDRAGDGYCGLAGAPQ